MGQFALRGRCPGAWPQLHGRTGVPDASTDTHGSRRLIVSYNEKGEMGPSTSSNWQRMGGPILASVDNILEEPGPLVREVHTAPDEPPGRHPAELALSDQERALLGQLDNHATGVDELIVRNGLTASQVLATLSVLELKRLVRRLPGHQFVRA